VFNCPHCQRPGITTINKLLSDSAAPARCELCGKLSHQSTILQLVASALAPAAVVIAALIAIHYSSWWPLIALPVLGIGVTAMALALPSTPATHASARRARWAAIYGLVFVIIAVLIAAFIDA
jgi:hypothetical protein